MGDMGDDFRFLKEMAKDERESRLESNMRYLNKIEADYEVYNAGYQLNFKVSFGTIAFYPSTNRWVLNGKTHYGNAEDLVNWVFKISNKIDWVKRLGQWHLADKNAIKTLCDQPMLGNNYAMHIPVTQRVMCSECWKEV